MGRVKNIYHVIEEAYNDGEETYAVAERLNLSEDFVAEVYADLDREREYDRDYDDSMDGDAASALASAGWGTDEDYGYYGEE